MKKLFLLFVICGCFTHIVFAGTHTTSISFEQSESALNALISTQVFPHPVGIYEDGDNEYMYDIYLWDPEIDIEPDIVTFSCTIYADLWWKQVKVCVLTCNIHIYLMFHSTTHSIFYFSALINC